jgi:hypothetical protein
MTDAQCLGWDTKRVPSGQKCFDRNGDFYYQARTVQVVDRMVLGQEQVVLVSHFSRFSLSSSSSFVSVLNLTTIHSGFEKLNLCNLYRTFSDIIGFVENKI